jgi:hypothetical protein
VHALGPDSEVSVVVVIHIPSLDHRTVLETVNKSGIPRLVEVVELLDYGEHC